MLSMRELRRAVGILRPLLAGHKLKRIVQADAFSLVFNCIDFRKNRSDILLSCDYEYAHVCITEESKTQNDSTGSFYEFICARLPGCMISGITVSCENRQVCLELETRSDCWKLYFSILGVRSNIYLTDAEGRLIHCMRPLEETRRDLRIGELWKEPPGSVPNEGLDRWAQVPDEEYLETIGREYVLLAAKRDALRLARKINQVLNKERTLLGRRLDRLHADLDKVRLAETFREKGELLKTVLHEIRPGDECVMVTDYRSGEVVDIPVDPKISPADNLEAYFSRYRKDLRGAKIIQQQIQKMEALREELDAAEDLARIALEKDPPEKTDLEKIESRPFVRRLINRYAPGRKRSSSPVKQKSESGIPKRLQPKRYRTEDGLEIWVGRNDEGNDYLTTRLARGNDLFFHLEGYPGSHVILRTEGRSNPPPSSILDACELAVHFSKMKNSGSADVHIAPAKNIKKPKGSKPGLVYVRQGKTIHLRRDPERLENILASRING